MKKETVFFGLFMFVLGILGGIAIPRYFSKESRNEFAPPAGTNEQGYEDLQQVRNYSQTILQLQSFLSSNPDNVEARIQLGNAYYDSRQWEKAIAEYSKALEKNPKNSDVRTDLGICYRELGQYDKALAEFKQAAADDPNHVNSRFNQGVVYHFDKRDYVNAKKAWEEYLKVASTGEKAEEAKRYLKQIDEALKGKG